MIKIERYRAGKYKQTFITVKIGKLFVEILLGNNLFRQKRVKVKYGRY